MSSPACLKLSNKLKVIAHPLRLEILSLLQQKEINVKNIQLKLKAKQSNTSQHLNALAKSGILKRGRKGQEVYYRIADPSILAILNSFRKFCSKKS